MTLSREMHGRHKKRTKKIVGYSLVAVVSVVLVACIAIGLIQSRDRRGSIDQNRSDVVIDGVGYEKNRDLMHILFIGVSDGSRKEAKYLTVLSIDQSHRKYFFTNIDSRIKTRVDPINEYGVSAGETSYIETTLGRAQVYGDGTQRSSWNTAYAIDRMLDINIRRVICMRLSSTEQPLFQTSPLKALESMKVDIMERTGQGVDFQSALDEICVWADDITGSGDIDALIEQLNGCECTSSPEPHALMGGEPDDNGVVTVSRQAINDLKIRLYLREIGPVSTTAEEHHDD